MMRFEDLGLDSKLLEAVSALGFSHPTEIQQKSIPFLLSDTNQDLVGLAQTGTGKTAAFGLPLLQKLDLSENHVQALVLSPTRELGLQITNELKLFAKFLPEIRIVAVYGGASIEDQIRDLKRGAHVVVATPGRLIDLLERNRVQLNKVGCVVLDEADEMLNMGFKEDLDTILQHLPKQRKTWLFSATMPAEVKRIARNYMNDPEEIVVGKQNSGNANIEHQYILVKPHDRYAALKRVLDFYPEIFGLIFCRTRTETKDVADQLMQDGYSAEALHGDLSQAQRDSVMKKFRQRNIQILVATDVAARGIDISDITHVVHYVLPDDIEVYTHRSGRTGRAGKKGISIAIISSREEKRIRDIEQQIRQKLIKIPVPKGQDIVKKQMMYLVEKIKSTEVNEALMQEDWLKELYQSFEDMEKTEIVQKFISTEFDRFFNYYKDSRDLKEVEESRSTKNARGESSRKVNAGQTRLFVNLGMLDDVNKGALLRLICDAGGISSHQVGPISLLREFSFIEVASEAADQVVNGVNGAVFQDKKVRVQFAKASESDRGGDRSRSGGRGGFGGNRSSSSKFRSSGSRPNHKPSDDYSY